MFYMCAAQGPIWNLGSGLLHSSVVKTFGVLFGVGAIHSELAGTPRTSCDAFLKSPSLYNCSTLSSPKGASILVQWLESLCLRPPALPLNSCDWLCFRGQAAEGYTEQKQQRRLPPCPLYHNSSGQKGFLWLERNWGLGLEKKSISPLSLSHRAPLPVPWTRKRTLILEIFLPASGTILGFVLPLNSGQEIW